MWTKCKNAQGKTWTNGPLFLFTIFWAGRGGKSALGTRLPCVPLCPLCLLCPLCSLCPLCPLSRVSRVPCIPCVPCVPCVPFPRVPCVPFAISKKWNVRWRCPCFMWRENFDGFLCFHMTTCGFFFARSGGQRDVIFHEKNVHKILLDLLRK